MADLLRFHAAQARVYDTAFAELVAGQKRSHWMWFIFPQLRGLGKSPTAVHYGIADMSEAGEYLADPVLGPRLTACANAVLSHKNKDVEAIFGRIDALKLCSSMTLFETANGSPVFGQVIDTFFSGKRCPLTLDLLGLTSH